MKFVDMETGIHMKLNPNEFREEYKKRYAAFLDNVKSRCLQYRVDFTEADINNDFREVLMPFLVKRQGLY